MGLYTIGLSRLLSLRFGNGFLVKFIGGIINPETGETPGEDTITENTKIRIDRKRLFSIRSTQPTRT